MDRKQQLEAMGMACVAAWQGRMTAVQAVPAWPMDLLHDALPSYRLWMRQLAQMHVSWITTVDGSNALLDSGMPWHWLEMAGTQAGLPSVAASSPTAPRSMQPILTPKAKSNSTTQVSKAGVVLPQTMHTAVAEHQILPENAGPLENLAQTKNSPKPENLDVHGPEKSAATPQQIVFRGLDDFAAFVQNPAMNSPLTDTPKSGGEKSEQHLQAQNSERTRLVENELNFGTPSAPSSPAALKHLADEKMHSSNPPLLDDFQFALPQSQANAVIQGNAMRPKALQENATDDGFWEQKPELQRPAAKPIEQAQDGRKNQTHFPAEFQQNSSSKKTASLPNWDQMQGELEKLTAPTEAGSAYAQPTPKSAVQKVVPTLAQKEKLSAPVAQDLTEPETPAAMYEHALPQQLAPQAPVQAWPAWPGSKTESPSFDSAAWMHGFMEAMTEQLQRDFKRYYGS